MEQSEPTSLQKQFGRANLLLLIFSFASTVSKPIV